MFEKHMQSNKSLTANGWETEVTIHFILNNIIFDSRTDSEGNLIKLTKEVVCLWLNNNHYDVILSMKKFNRLNNFCVKCMSHYKLFKHKDNHVCCTKLTCQKCFRQSNCSHNMNGDKFQCNNCKILFYDQDCF